VPVFSVGGVKPACVVSFYAFLRIESVPFVLRFLQQALRLLWRGLDLVVPHSSVRHNLWKEVVPADLGEMAADVKMQKTFFVKKRPHEAISLSNTPGNSSVESLETTTYSLSSELDQIVSSSEIEVEDRTVNLVNDMSITNGNFATTKQIVDSSAYKSWSTMHNNLQEAVISIGGTVFKTIHESFPSNKLGTKRAHMITKCEPSIENTYTLNQSDSAQINSQEPSIQTPTMDCYQTKSSLTQPQHNNDFQAHQSLSESSSSSITYNQECNYHLTASQTPNNLNSSELQNSHASNDQHHTYTELKRPQFALFKGGRKERIGFANGYKNVRVITHVDHSKQYNNQSQTLTPGIHQYYKSILSSCVH